MRQLLHEINKVKNGPDGALIEFKATINFQASDGEEMFNETTVNILRTG